MHEITTAMDADGQPPGLAACLRRLADVLRRRWRLIASVSLACSLAAGLYLARAERLYEATARLLLLQKGGRPLVVGRDDGTRSVERSEDFIPTQVAILQSPRVVGRAIESVGSADLPTLRGRRGGASVEEMTRASIKYYLKVSRPDRTASIVAIRYRAASPGEATRMASALVDSYEDFLLNNERDDNNKVVSIITHARDELSRELEGLEAKYLELQKTNPLLLEDESSRPLVNSRLVELDRAANEAMVKAVRLRSQLEIGRKLAKEGAEMWAIAYAITQVGADPGVALIPRPAESLQGASADYLRQLIREQQELSAAYGPDYSKAKALQEEIAGIQERTREAMGRLDRGGVGQLLDSIARSLESVEAMRAEVARQLKGDMEKAQKNAIDLTVGRSLHDRLERQKSLFFATVEQLKQAQFEGDYGGIVSRTIERANALDKPVQPNVPLVLAGALALGLILGVLAALTCDELDSRIHSFEDLRRSFNFPVLGLISRIAPNQLSATAEGGLISQLLPRSPSAEAYKVLRTNLEFLHRSKNVQVILITSSLAQEGKTTTASNLAIGLANAGRKVLLVDADLRRPGLDRIYHLPGEYGLAHVLRDRLPLRRAVQPTPIGNLDVVSAGGEVANPAELLMSDRMRALIDEARASYDFVIFDSSPLLAVTDPALIGASADGVVLVVRASLLKRPLLSRAVELLQAAGTPILGTVITGIETGAFDRQYGYGTYRSDGSPQPGGPPADGAAPPFARNGAGTAAPIPGAERG